MRIEKNYFTEEQRLIEQEQREILQARQQQSPEETAAENARITTEVDRAMEIYEQCQKEKEKDTTIDLNIRFFEMAHKINTVAEWLRIDMLIEAHAKDMGEITLTTNLFTIDEYSPIEIRTAFLEVISAADEIQISSKGELTELKLYFRRFDTVTEG